MIPGQAFSSKVSYVELPENELINLALKIDSHNDLLCSIKNSLAAIEKNKEYREISSLKRLIERNLEEYNSEQEVKLLKDNFKQKLNYTYPILSANDIKFASLIRLNYSTKQLADILCINIRSVEKKRNRLKRKMNLSENQKITEILELI